jgi:hypothetical protein
MQKKRANPNEMYRNKPDPQRKENVKPKTGPRLGRMPNDSSKSMKNGKHRRGTP